MTISKIYNSIGQLEPQSNLFNNIRIEKRRKVNKSQFLQGDTGLIFENTFAHRDQVYGEIDKKEK